MTTIGGYRVVRTLGSGPHAAVLLGHPRAGGSQVALKVSHGEDRERAFRELDALDAAADPAVVRLLDACTDDRGIPVGILELLPPTPLAELLARGAPPRPGAIVGVVSAVAEALDRLHSRGVVHGALNASNVLVRDDGTPVLVGFARSSARGDRPTLAARDDDPGMGEDCANFARLAVALLESSGTRDATSIVGVGALVSSGLAAVADRLRREVAPEPFLPPATVVYPVPAAVQAPRAAVPLVPRRGRRRAERRPLTRRGRDFARGAIDSVTASARAIRPRFWVAGGAALVALLGALVLVPGPATDAVTPERGQAALDQAGSSPPSPALSSRPSSQARVEALSDVEAEPVTPVVSDAATRSASEAEIVESALGLLEQRRSCLAERSMLCLTDVTAADSPARRDDEALVEQLRADQTVPDPLAGATGEIRLVDFYGGAALLTIDCGNTAAPVLVMKTGAGWRIRAYPGG
jgi:hypothetical protein